MKIELFENKKIYFASDNHLGAPDFVASRQREKAFVQWLDRIKPDAGAVFLLGDLFDFWFEYKTVIPKGFTRTLGKLAEFTDGGIPVFFFVGNHDLWMRDYFQKELNIPVFHKPLEFECNGKRFLVGHGDGLGPDDKGYKRMKKVFANPLAQWLFRWLHPDIGVRLAQYLSVKNKLISGDDDVKFLGEEKEWLVQYCKRKLQTKHYDYFLFGHRHLPMEIPLGNSATYINTGDWMHYFTYAVFDGKTTKLIDNKLKTQAE
ncbi:UDP-2,3-diacylglucosamine diphosphatase [Capnocytophaga sp.]|uniref:UDP-2,3-diacylglucosamine diphosphatase n=1 Tax=Capnocytophaga sp. TaxID=44737 RepID=UPI0026DD1E8A|nr:UDP-2,3-diacylglucosamine diphosphatase [Capnocytophaga sp.]MDO5106266.1 UDP-2,3-diacylglucosamine diphosphatase [Capnocytophaga sp.]